MSNAVSNLLREIEQRYDFKGSHCEVVLNKDTITVNADDDLKLRQIHEILKGHLSKRNIDAGVLDFKKVDQAAGQAVRQDIALIQGIDKDLSKNIIKEIKFPDHHQYTQSFSRMVTIFINGLICRMQYQS